MQLSDKITFLTGVGERRATLLEKELGIITAGDLLYFFPFRYMDRTRFYRIGEVSEQSAVSFVQLRVRIAGFSIQGAGAKQRFKAIVQDSTGQAELVWFKGIKWIEKRLEKDREYVVFGRPSFFNGSLSMVHPEIELVQKVMAKGGQGVEGVYATTEKLTSVGLGSKGIFNLVLTLWNQVADNIRETLPEQIRKRANVVGLKEALHDIHFPPSQAALRSAEYRLKFEELFGIQLNILSLRTTRTRFDNGFLFPKVGECFNTFYHHSLPFSLTDAQKRVIREIRNDTITGHQMNRLLQGDVGSGKTLVALITMLLAADNGYQSALMAPTEILARQHYATIEKLLRGTPAQGRVDILTGATRTKERNQILERTLSGQTLIMVGTHALLEDRVQFDNLAMVVIDEQHRFGVEQRARMWTKNSRPPHILVMTATPIPRTLAMTVYGDLDVSVIDELPPGRKPIETRHMYDSQRLMLFGFMKRQIAAGRQVYVVYPLIKESEKMDYKDLYDGFESLSRDFPLPKYRIGVVHGQMKNEDKQQGMEEFKRGEKDILVATSVIEVGVDVPNATVMVIESAERFGLSQLHQLRGRVGRGAEQSYCILMSGDKLSKEARERLNAMVETTDGFVLSELDMRLRGSGDLNGTRQSGEAFDLKIASLSTDSRILEFARDMAGRVLDDDPKLSKPTNKMLLTLKERFTMHDKDDLGMIS